MLGFYKNGSLDLEWILEIMKCEIFYFMNKDIEVKSG